VILKLFPTEAELFEEEMSEYWTEHKPDKKEYASCQKDDFTSDIELY